MTSVAGGYPLEIIKHGETEEIQRKFICAKCKLILKNPFQLFCGHRYCKDCLPDPEENGSMCPSCREEGVAEDDDCVEPTKTFPDNAIRREMGSLQVVCVQSGCSWEGRFKTFEAHLSECGFFPITCDLCRKRIPRNKVQAHLASKCDTIDLKAFKCPFGCEDVITDQPTLDNHEKQNQSHHLKSLLNEIRQVQSKVSSISSEPLVQASSSHSIASGPQFSRITNLEGAIVVISKDLASIYDKVSDIERQQNRTDEELKKAQSLERQLLKYEASLHELQTRIEFVEKTSYDGFLIWKVEGYSKHKENAVNGQITSIYSPYFFTSRPGYKICTRLYLNGDGMGKGTHISLFFVLMKGPHDAILSWPFDIPVKFELMDLSGGKDNVVDTFRPDPSSSSFKRPSTNMNIASGCPTFISISDFEMKKQKFVKEDALYIKIEVSPHLLNTDK